MKSKNLFLIFIFGLFIFILPSVVEAACPISCGCGGSVTPVCCWTWGGSSETLGILSLGTVINGCPLPDYVLSTNCQACPPVGGSCREGSFFSGTNGQNCAAIDGCWSLLGGCTSHIKSGFWDASDSKCVSCNGKIEQYIRGNASAIYADCSNDEGNAGDGQCESACGADVQCDELTYGSNIPASGGVCNNCVFSVPKPSLPSTVNCLTVSSSQINVSWEFVSGATYYEVYYCQGTTCTPTTYLGQTSSLSYSHTGLSPGTSYRYRVKACNTSGCSDYSISIATCITQVIVNCLTVSSSQIDVSWTSVSGATYYEVYYCQGTTCTPSTLLDRPSSNSYSHTGLSPSTSYRYRVKACNTSGCSDYSISIAMCTTQATSPPSSPPSSVNCLTVSSSQIDVSWTSVSGATYYEVYYCQGTTCTPTTYLGQTSSSPYSHTGLSPSTSYRYRVKACNVGGCSSSYSSATNPCTTLAAPPPSPPVPTVSCLTDSDTQITVSWTNVANESGYYIYRCSGSGCTPTTQVNSVGADVISWVNSGLSANTTYGYRVIAWNAGGNSPYSNITYCTTLAGVPVFDFSISVNPDSGSVAQGGSTSPSTVTATLLSGTSQTISFYISSGLPSGASPSFNPPSCSPPCNSSMVISTSATTTPTGTYPLVVCGTSGTVTHCYTYTLNVIEAGTAINPPLATTTSATNITQTSATLNGTLTNMGGATSCLVWFEWGATGTEGVSGSYGNSTTPVSMTAIGFIPPVTISGLTSGQTYYFEAFAKNGGSW